MAIRHKYSIVCDEVRREDNGKLIVVGMYTGIITVTSFPATLPSFTILNLFEGDRQESWPFRLEIKRLETGALIAQAHGFATVPQAGTGVMPVRFSPMQFQEGGSYSVELVAGQDAPLHLLDFEVRYAAPQMMMPPMQPPNPFNRT